MENQISTSAIPQESKEPQAPVQTFPELQTQQTLPAININDLEAMKQRARELAIAQYMAQKQSTEPAPSFEFSIQNTQPAINSPQPQIVYVKRNLTVAELLLVFALSVGVWSGIQFTWNFALNTIPKIEVNIRK